MTYNKTIVTSSCSFSTLLLLTFIILKLTNVIAWKWIWVLSPLWIEAGIVILILLIYLIVFLILKANISRCRKKLLK